MFKLSNLIILTAFLLSNTGILLQAGEERSLGDLSIFQLEALEKRDVAQYVTVRQTLETFQNNLKINSHRLPVEKYALAEAKLNEVKADLGHRCHVYTAALTKVMNHMPRRECSPERYAENSKDLARHRGALILTNIKVGAEILVVKENLTSTVS